MPDMRARLRMIFVAAAMGCSSACLSAQVAYAVLGDKLPGRVHTPDEIANIALHGMVQVLATDKDGKQIVIGSGFAVSPIDILTASHLVPGDTPALLKAFDGDHTFSSIEVLKRDEEHDLVLLAVPGIDRKPIPLSRGNASAGDFVYLPSSSSAALSASEIGAPSGANLTIVAAIPEANSGAPVIDDHGKVAGLAVGEERDGKSVSYVVPAAAIRELTAPLQQKAQEVLQFGLDSLKGYKYEDAAENFDEVTMLDPALTVGWLDLGNAGVQMVVPDLAIPQNIEAAHKAIDAYEHVLDDDPGNLSVMHNVVFAYLNIREFDKAREWQQKILKLTPDDPDAFYQFGVIDSNQAVANSTSILIDHDLLDDEKGNAKLSAAACAELKKQNEQIVTDGMTQLERAIKLRPAFGDAMYYLSVLYRRKAEMECGNGPARTADVATANNWRSKAKANGSELATPTVGYIGGVIGGTTH